MDTNKFSCVTWQAGGILPEDVREKLRKPFPPEAIQEHSQKTFLSVIKAMYVIERLNDVFGIGGWFMEHEIISDTPDYVVVRGRLHIAPPYAVVTFDQYGGHRKTGKGVEPADGYKSAVTDCLSKCASLLEVGIDVFKGKASQGKGSPPKAPTATARGGQKAQNRNNNGDSIHLITTEQRNTLMKLMSEKALSHGEQASFFRHVMGTDKKQHTLQKANDFIVKFDEYLEEWQKAVWQEGA